MGRPADPTRKRRGTGNRPAAGETPPATTGVVAIARPAELTGRDLYPPPADLPAPAVAIWDRIVDELAPRGLREADLEAIRMMSIAAHRHRQASAEIERLGILVKGQRGPMLNPLLKVEKDQAAIYQRLAEAFGLTVAARLRLGLMQLAGETMLQGLARELDETVAREWG